MKRVFLVNPVATKCPRDIEPQILALFPKARVQVTARAGDMARFARLALSEELGPEDVTVSCGGDGTFREVAETVAGEVKIGILRLGTVNLVAKSPGIPDRLESALEVFGSGVPVEIYPGGCVLDQEQADRMYFIAVSVGPDADAAHAVRALGKRLLGPYT